MIQLSGYLDEGRPPIIITKGTNFIEKEQLQKDSACYSDDFFLRGSAKRVGRGTNRNLIGAAVR